jgi:hypothetical protein
MRGLDARIHVLLCYAKNVDGRVRPGHDDSFRFAHLRSRYQPVEHRPDQRGCRLFYCHACILHCGKNVVSRFSSAHAIWNRFALYRVIYVEDTRRPTCLFFFLLEFPLCW